MKNILITGGARSGKSTFAELLFKDMDVVYIATSFDNDLEMNERILLHKAQRNKNWFTIESQHQFEELKNKNVLIDCLSIFTSNVMYLYTKGLEYINYEVQQNIENHIIIEVNKLISNNNCIFVTNEVGMSLVPMNHIERVYRDILGRVNQRVAQQCDEVFLVVAGQTLKIK